MEEHFLKDHVSGLVHEESQPWYNPDGDCIIYQTTDEAVVADRVDDLLTVLRSAESGKAIGFKVKGVGAIIRLFGLDGLGVVCNEANKEIKHISLFTLLLAAYERGPKTIGRRVAYADAMGFGSRLESIRLEEPTLSVN